MCACKKRRLSIFNAPVISVCWARSSAFLVPSIVHDTLQAPVDDSIDLVVGACFARAHSCAQLPRIFGLVRGNLPEDFVGSAKRSEYAS